MAEGFVLSARILSMLKNKGLDRCQNKDCKSPILKVGDVVVSRKSEIRHSIEHKQCWEGRYIG